MYSNETSSGQLTRVFGHNKFGNNALRDLPKKLAHAEGVVMADTGTTSSQEDHYDS